MKAAPSRAKPAVTTVQGAGAVAGGPRRLRKNGFGRPGFMGGRKRPEAAPPPPRAPHPIRGLTAPTAEPFAGDFRAAPTGRPCVAVVAWCVTDGRPSGPRSQGREPHLDPRPLSHQPERLHGAGAEALAAPGTGHMIPGPCHLGVAIAKRHPDLFDPLDSRHARIAILRDGPLRLSQRRLNTVAGSRLGGFGDTIWGFRGHDTKLTL